MKYLQEPFCICLQLKIKIETYFFIKNGFTILDFTLQDTFLLRSQTVHWIASPFQLLQTIFSSNLELCHRNKNSWRNSRFSSSCNEIRCFKENCIHCLYQSTRNECRSSYIELGEKMDFKWEKYHNRDRKKE